MSRVYLVSKSLDPVLGVVSGLWAYQLYESRLERPAGHTLPELLKRKWDIRQAGKKVAAATGKEEEGWNELQAELDKVQDKVKAK